ncbi:MAG TPA: TonB-dependent receptor [Hyphomonadaceae bacterium]|nr:TonB-dependent receptor [Hyphomonadaceae bacterium]
MSKLAIGSHIRSSSIRVLLLASTALAMAGTALAQQVPAAPEPPEEGRDVVVVVGSQIIGAQPTEALPVTVIGQKELDAIAATSGDDLFRSIPQLGDVAYNTTRTVGGVNDARGDTASINLRALGTGNTLVLLNGRRMVNHPGTQAENLVPVVTVNTNSIPTTGVRRIEVLLDGASAIYGADAVAGVVNTVLKTDFEGLTAELNFGSEEGVHSTERSAAIEYGVNFNEDRTNLSLFASYLGRDPIYASERPFSANADLRSRLPAAWRADVNASAGFNNTSTTSAWGGFDRYTTGNLTVNGAAVSNAAGQFHIQPTTLPGCLAGLGNGICIDDASARDADLRYNVNDPTTTQNGVDRYNAFLFLNHEFDGGLELFGELGGYLAKSVGYREQAPMLGAVPIVIPATNYYNPFGPVGSPNRLAVTNAPAGGLAISLVGYRPVDAGARKTEVENASGRALLGLRGTFADWDWESALLYSQANTEDKENRISNTLFQAALARSTPDAYNPFNGGCIGNLQNGDCTPTSAATINDITVDVFRKNQTSIASWDLKLSKPDLFQIWSGDIGAAVGVELRRETFKDDRDPRQDGTINFTDSISGLTTNDLLGQSGSLDTKGQRDVQSAYAEFAVPLVSPEMEVPFVQAVDMQLAVRYENFDTFGSVTKPKVALSWRPFDWMLVRSAWSEGFRAPNLQQQYEAGLQRSNVRTDYIRCEAAVRQARAAGQTPPVFTTACATVPGTSQSVISSRAGSASLKPEESTNMTYGFVFDGTFLPPDLGKVSFTADWWRIEQDNVVGIFGDGNQILLDYVMRLNGSSNPAVVRAAPDADDTAAFAGTQLAPAGDILFVDDNYLNLDSRTVQGWDFGLYYDLDGTAFGDFSFRFNAALLDKFYQGVSANGIVINQAAASGVIPSQLSVSGQGDLVRDYGRPEWRFTSSLTWRNEAWGAGWFTSYVGDVFDDFNLLSNQPWIIEEYQTHNLYVQYELGHDTDKPLRLRVGARNITNEAPPLAATNFGYLGDLHSAQGRFMYVNVRKTF